MRNESTVRNSGVEITLTLPSGFEQCRNVSKSGGDARLKVQVPLLKTQV